MSYCDNTVRGLWKKRGPELPTVQEPCDLNDGHDSKTVMIQLKNYLIFVNNARHFFEYQAESETIAICEYYPNTEIEGNECNNQIVLNLRFDHKFKGVNKYLD
ncbi:17261_t:CDS:2 [Racocetra persica]|uniref:17261_t:CDS:1 n=1 Tax=Racocetra persica TaxID=160502 RepID=A0ACA9KPK3_9GLOM|nr:17261_t:CDS:2 [Racocetra persica]